MRTLLLSLLLGACAPKDNSKTTGLTDTAPSGDDTSLELDPENLHGDAPEAVIPAPEFEATNYDGTLRDRTALLGHPTVMWFFPFAGTPG